MSNVDSDKMEEVQAVRASSVNPTAPSPYPYRATDVPPPREPGANLKVAQLSDRTNIAVGMLNDANADLRGCINRVNILADRLVGEPDGGVEQDAAIPDPIGTFGMVEHNIAQYMHLRRCLDVALSRLEVL